MKSLQLKAYAALGGVIVVLLVMGYIGFLRYQVKDLKADNRQLTVDLSASRVQVAALSERDAQNKKVEAEYEKLRAELRNKENGPVADVLRFAIDSDLVLP